MMLILNFLMWVWQLSDVYILGLVVFILSEQVNQMINFFLIILILDNTSYRH